LGASKKFKARNFKHKLLHLSIFLHTFLPSFLFYSILTPPPPRYGEIGAERWMNLPLYFIVHVILLVYNSKLNPIVKTHGFCTGKKRNPESCVGPKKIFSYLVLSRSFCSTITFLHRKGECFGPVRIFGLRMGIAHLSIFQLIYGFRLENGNHLVLGRMSV
jgi:hypothetical protein